MQQKFDRVQLIDGQHDDAEEQPEDRPGKGNVGDFIDGSVKVVLFCVCVSKGVWGERRC